MRSPYLASMVRMVVAAAPMLLLTAGCDVQNPLDPTEVGRYNKQALWVPILSHLDKNIEEPDDSFLNATDVEPADLKAPTGDYTIGANDLLSISVSDLVAPGMETVKAVRVGESGNVSLPLIGTVAAAGLTESQLEQAIAKAYADAKLIQRAQVSVTTVEARARTFSALGVVGAPGLYAITSADFRLLDAMVVFRDLLSPAPDYIYVIRKPQAAATAKPGPAAPVTPAAPSTTPDRDLLEPKSPTTRGVSLADGRGVTLLKADGATSGPVVDDGEGRYVTVDGKPVLIKDNTMKVEALAGKKPSATAPAARELGAEDFKGFGQVSVTDEPRVIRVPVASLKNGDLKYNIAIFPHDMIIAPTPVSGEYYMGGHVQRVGVYSLSARKITLKQAVVAAGMFDAVAIPSRTQIIRRIGPDKEVFARVDLAQIFSGEIPDIYLKPNDVVQVGTNLTAPYAAAIRNAFRFTYGFGFLYDRNFYTGTTTGR